MGVVIWLLLGLSGCAAGASSHSARDASADASREAGLDGSDGAFSSRDAAPDATTDATTDAPMHAQIDAVVYADAQSPSCNVNNVPFEYGPVHVECWTIDALRASPGPPHLSDPTLWPERDAGDLTCPNADVFRWGPDGESCVPIALCNQPQPTSEPNTCCYVTGTYCGV